MIIKNKKQLATTKLRKIALNLIEAGIEKVLPANLMHFAVRYTAKQKVLIARNKKYSLKNGRIFVIGGGKASGLMALELEKIIGAENITAGAVNCINNNYKTKKIKIIKASHPVPNQNGVKGVEEMLALKKEYAINKNDLIICLISGGASALMPCPVDGVSLKDKQNITKLLLSSGAQIQEINTVRKHLSKIKGGQLGKFFAPATVVSLIISDVVGDDLGTIASGLTAPDFSTFQDAYNVLKKYNLLYSEDEMTNEGEIHESRLHLSSRLQVAIAAHLKKGCACSNRSRRAGKAPETPNKLNNCRNHIIGNNKSALGAMADKAYQLNLKPLIITSEQVGDPVRMANIRAKEMIDGKYTGYNVIIVGGETTPKLSDNHGRGGRNQHFVAASMLAMQKYSGDWVMANVSTDGSDYLADVAGAIVDNDSFGWAKSRGADVKKYLARYDSNSLFRKIGRSLIITGDTGTNVGDVMVYVLG